MTDRMPHLNERVRFEGSVWDGRIASLWRPDAGMSSEVEVLVIWDNAGWGDAPAVMRLSDLEWAGEHWRVKINRLAIGTTT